MKLVLLCVKTKCVIIMQRQFCQLLNSQWLLLKRQLRMCFSQNSVVYLKFNCHRIRQQWGEPCQNQQEEPQANLESYRNWFVTQYITYNPVPIIYRTSLLQNSLKVIKLRILMLNQHTLICVHVVCKFIWSNIKWNWNINGLSFCVPSYGIHGEIFHLTDILFK